MARIKEILDEGDVRELISTLADDWHADYCWPFDSPSEHVRCVLDSQVKWFIRRVQRVLQDGIPQRDVIANFAYINFAEDSYCWVKDASADVLDAIRLNSSLLVIYLDYCLSTSDIDQILEAVAEKHTLTTLIGPDNLVLSADILEKNHHILFLPYRTCRQPCTEQHPLCNLVCRNQKEWRDRAHSAGWDVAYAIGFSSSWETGIGVVGDEISLYSGAECLIMVYMQSTGRLKLSLHHRQGWHHRRWGMLSLRIFFRSGDATNEWEEVRSIYTEDIPERYTNKPHEIVIPGELSAGYHEIRTHTKAEYSYYLHSAIVTRYESDTDSAPEDV